jgi:hypothetical protein
MKKHRLVHQKSVQEEEREQTMLLLLVYLE